MKVLVITGPGDCWCVGETDKFEFEEFFRKLDCLPVGNQVVLKIAEWTTEEFEAYQETLRKQRFWEGVVR